MDLYGPLIVAAGTSFFLGQLSWGLFYFILFTVVIEILVWYAFPNDRNCCYRILLIIVSLIGWILGRLVVGDYQFWNLRVRPRQYSQVHGKYD